MISICDFLQRRCNAGDWSIGQIAIAGTVLRHLDDKDTGGLEIFRHFEDARELAKYDDRGSYRPLKTAPNLRRGWRLELASIAELRLALDFFYPAAIGTWLAYESGKLSVVPLRETLDRQSGMYRVTQLITDEQAGEVIRQTCDPETGCLRHQLWNISPALPSPMTRHPEQRVNFSVPVLCAEACNLLVAACRPVAKRNLPQAEP